ncbi:hypothetical protein BpHYR1_000355 [Brachionus plicatilis]|uniref:Uncharacterized protein n=1 Tax=Brachionus plicatilis TaxID=10195 RepID=A0A3M7SCC3_BRAPC|nr:hypothetical protein BpHYR1_000355 [Brachionus plicatilis]
MSSKLALPFSLVRRKTHISLNKKFRLSTKFPCTINIRMLRTTDHLDAYQQTYSNTGKIKKK